MPSMFLGNASKAPPVPYNRSVSHAQNHSLETIQIEPELLDVDADDVQLIQVSDLIGDSSSAPLTPKEEEMEEQTMTVSIKEEFQNTVSGEELDFAVQRPRFSEGVNCPPSSTQDRMKTKASCAGSKSAPDPFIDISSHYLFPSSDPTFSLSNLDTDPSLLQNSLFSVSFKDTLAFTVGHIDTTSAAAVALKNEGIQVIKCVYQYSLKKRLLESLESIGSINCSHCSCKNTNIDCHLEHVNWSHSGHGPKCCPLCSFQSRHFRTYREHEATHALEGLVHCVHCRRYFSNKAAFDIHLDILTNGCFWKTNKFLRASSQRQHQREIVRRTTHLLFMGSIVCPHCSYSNSDIFQYLKHALVHATGRRMVCVLCPSVQFTLKSYEEHKASHDVHGEVSETSQPTCDKNTHILPNVEPKKQSCNLRRKRSAHGNSNPSSSDEQSETLNSMSTAISSQDVNISNAILPSTVVSSGLTVSRDGTRTRPAGIGTVTAPSLDCIRCNKLFTDIKKYKRHLIPCSSGATESDNINLSKPVSNINQDEMPHVEESKAPNENTLPGDVSFQPRKNIVLAKRLASHSIDEIIYCPHCKFSCSGAPDYLQHVAASHSSATQRACLHCAHISEKGKDRKFAWHRIGRFKCLLCDMHFCRLFKYSFHMRHVHQEKVLTSKKEEKEEFTKLVHKCRQCDFQTTDYSELTDHWGTTHESVLRSCPCCSYSDHSKLKFVEHLKTHLPSGKHACPHCYFKHDSEEKALLHLSQHIIGGTLVCRHCLEEQSNQRVDSTSFEAPFESKKQCNKCSYSTICKTDYDLHQALHDVERSKKAAHLSCKLCDYKTPYKGSLKFHMARHTGQGIRNCPHCKYSTPYKRSMIFHMSKHTGEGMLFCKFCPFSTCYKAIFQHHQALHTKQGMLKCPHEGCGYTTPYRATFQQHLKKHSPDLQNMGRKKSERWTTEDRWTMLFALEYSKALRSDTKSFSKSWQKIFYHHCSKPNNSTSKAHSLKANVDLHCPFKEEAVERLKLAVAKILADKLNPLDKPVPMGDLAEDNLIGNENPLQSQVGKKRWSIHEKWTVLWIDCYLRAAGKRRKEFGREFKQLLECHCPGKTDNDYESLMKLRTSLRKHAPFKEEEIKHMQKALVSMVENEICPLAFPVARLFDASAEATDPDQSSLLDDSSCSMANLDSEPEDDSGSSSRSATNQTDVPSTKPSPSPKMSISSDPESCELKASSAQSLEPVARTTIQMRMFKKSSLA